MLLRLAEFREEEEESRAETREKIHDNLLCVISVTMRPKPNLKQTVDHQAAVLKVWRSDQQQPVELDTVPLRKRELPLFILTLRW